MLNTHFPTFNLSGDCHSYSSTLPPRCINALPQLGHMILPPRRFLTVSSFSLLEKGKRQPHVLHLMWINLFLLQIYNFIIDLFLHPFHLISFVYQNRYHMYMNHPHLHDSQIESQFFYGNSYSILPFCFLQSEFQNISLFKKLREGGRKTENKTLLSPHTGVKYDFSLQ